MCILKSIGYNDVTVIPTGARHVNIMDDSTASNMFMGTCIINIASYIHMYIHTYTCNMAS